MSSVPSFCSASGRASNRPDRQGGHVRIVPKVIDHVTSKLELLLTIDENADCAADLDRDLNHFVVN